MNSQIRSIKVRKIYRLGGNDLVALHNVSLDIVKGEFAALSGSSGSGKTTLLNLLGGLDSPTHGEIQIENNRITSLSDNDLALFRARDLGFIFQTFNLLPVLSALENVEYPLLKSKLTTAERRKMGHEALNLVGLSGHAAHRPNQMSGGQRQRVAIARAIVHRPKIILADEPTANLDKKTAAEIINLLSELNSNLGVTIVVATHDPDVIKRAKRSIHISDGQLVAS
jgi:putative ABC transport system ATP-binding protein